MVDLWVLHIDSLRRIFEKFNENPSKGSGDMERTRKCYDGQTKAISIVSHPLCGGGLKNLRQLTFAK